MTFKERFTDMKKRYGWGGLLRNAMEKLLGLVRLHVSRWHMYALPLSDEDIAGFAEKLSGHAFRELTLKDFTKQAVLNPEWFTPAKVRDMERGLAIKGNHAFGLFNGDLLICYGWISLNRFGVDSARLLPTDAYLWDVYTHPDYRGKRLQSCLTHYCLVRGIECGKSRAVVVVADYNRASRRTYKRTGFQIIDRFWNYSFGHENKHTTAHYHRFPANTDVVVVGGSHYNTLWVARSLGLAGYRPTVIVVCDHDKSFVTRSRYIRHSFVVSTDEEMVDVLRNELHFTGRTMVFASSDSAAAGLDRHFDELSARYFLPNCGGRQGELSRWMKKDVMVEQAGICGFTVPRSVQVDLENRPAADLDGIPFPCIVKPLKSSEGHKTDFRICKDSDALLKAFSELQADCRHVQVQQYIRPDYEISVLCFRHRAAGICAVPGLLKKLATCQSVSNLGMPTFAQVLKKLTPLVNEDIVKRFVETIDYHGLFSIEFFVKDGVPYFLEINLRVDGDLFVYTTGGCNMPRLFMELTQNPERELSDKRLHISREAYGMTEISFVKYTWRRPLHMLRVWWQTDCYSIFSWRDPLPFLFKFIHP